MSKPDERAANEAAKPNAALVALSGLVGTWNTVGTHPLVPGVTFHGQTSFSWLEGGAFLIMRSQTDEPQIPSGIAIFGSDDGAGSFSMQYFDERGVSRHYEVSVRPNVVEWSRQDPQFSQRCEVIIAADGRTMSSTGQFSRDGAAWEDDLALTFTRVE